MPEKKTKAELLKYMKTLGKIDESTLIVSTGKHSEFHLSSKAPNVDISGVRWARLEHLIKSKHTKKDPAKRDTATVQGGGIGWLPEDVLEEFNSNTSETAINIQDELCEIDVSIHEVADEVIEFNDVHSPRRNAVGPAQISRIHDQLAKVNSKWTKLSVFQVEALFSENSNKVVCLEQEGVGCNCQ